MSKFFTISIGSNGSIVLLKTKKKIIESIYCEKISDKEVQDKILSLFKNNKKAQIYLILDNIGQNYNKKSFPNVNFFDLQNLVKRKFNYEIPKDDLKDRRFLGKNKKTKYWEYMFISSPIDEVIEVWLRLINNTENILAGIYMLPLEMENILKKLKNKIKIKKNESSLDIILTKNKVSGFREITFINGKLAFTRILNENLSDQYSFNYQFNENIMRNIEYLKRFYNNFNMNNLNIYTITDKTTKDFINNLDTKKDYKIKILSYEEFSNIFKIKNKVDKFLEYGDIIFEELIMSSKKIISFSTKEMKKLAKLSILSKILSKVFVISFILLFSSVFLNLFYILKNNYKIEEANKNLEKVTLNLEEKRKKEFGNNELDVDNIINITSFYNSINEIGKQPFDFLKKFSSSFQNGEIIVNNLNWKMGNFNKNTLSKNTKLSIYMDANILNKSAKVDDLFKIYENSTNIMKTNFENYDISISKLPTNINFNTKYPSFPIKINVLEK